MATIDLRSNQLAVNFRRTEKLAGLLRDVEVPLHQVVAVTVEPDGLRAARGLRAPGLAIPGRRKIGTWRRPGRRTALSVTAGEPAVRIRLQQCKFHELLIGQPDAYAVADRIEGARQSARRP
jgi:hypothetical protein